ncbi:ketoacyl-ACP synthase III [Streptomyces sp. NBC_00457]|uniref:ketoacyl-ACP synthase III n=1 Tax=Streptomyces sp. NBC_00457 TaxID=2975748 RepID=UPI002E1CD4F5
MTVFCPPVELAGIGHDFPGEPVRNDHFTSRPELGVDEEWILRHTGVAARHWPPEGERHVDMAERAARRALAEAELEPGDVDVILGTSATARPRVNPTSPGNNYMDVALPVQRRLGAPKAMCLDVTGVACSGFLHASAVARGLIATGHRTVLIVCAENPRPILNFSYRNSVLFGGGAAAGVWRANPGADDGLHAVTLHSDATHYDAFDIDEHDTMVMKGKVVGEFAPGVLADATRRVLRQADADLDDVDWIIPHQGNINLIHDVQDALGIRDDKRVLLNIERRGNTSSVSVPSCLSEYVHDGTITPGDRILSMAIGRGFSWGAMLFSYGRPRPWEQ